MTRKTWNRLRRQRPELFENWLAWERMNEHMLRKMRAVSRRDLIAEASSFRLGRQPAGGLTLYELCSGEVVPF